MKFLFAIGVLMLCLVGLPQSSLAQSGSTLGISRVDGLNVRLSWPVSVVDWVLEGSNDLRTPGSWMIESAQPNQSGGSWTLGLAAVEQSHFFRLRTGSIIFVDSSSPTSGNGSFTQPFRNISLAVADARVRFINSGAAQTIYVIAGDYSESVVVDGSGLANYKLTLLDNSTAIGANGGTIGGDPAMIARLTGAAGMPALMVREVADFRLCGFRITSADAVNTSDAPSALHFDNVLVATVQRTQLIGGRGGDGEDATAAADGEPGGMGGAGVYLDNHTTLNVNQGSSLTGGVGGNGGDEAGAFFAGDSGLGGSGIVSMNAGNVINVSDSTSTGGLAGFPGNGGVGIFYGGFSGNGIFLDDSTTISVKHSIIAGGDASAGRASGGAAIFVANGYDTGGLEPSNIYVITIDKSTVRGGNHADSTATLEKSSGGSGIEIFESTTTLRILNNSLIQGRDGGRQSFDEGGNFGGDSSGGNVGIFTLAAGEIVISDSDVSGGRGGDAGPVNGVAGGGGDAFFVGTSFDTPGQLTLRLNSATIRAGDAGTGGGQPAEMVGNVTLLRIVEGGRGIWAEDYLETQFTLISNNSQISGGAGSDSSITEPASAGGEGIISSGHVTLNINSGSVVEGGAGGTGTAAFNGAVGGDGIAIFGGGVANLNNSTVTGGGGGNAIGTGTGGQGGLGTDTVDPFPLSEPNGPGIVNNNGSTVTIGPNGTP